MNEYLLMNKNKKLILFSLELDNFSQYLCKQLECYVERSALPPDFNNIHDWVVKRNYAKHKEHLKRWLKDWHIDTIGGFLDITHALGLNDTLWVKKAGDNLTWENVSLYSNDFTDVVAKTAFSTGLHGLKLSTTSPEFTSEGSFEKCWVREDDNNIYLYKKGSSGFANAGLEPYSEFYSSQLSSTICKSALPYDLMMFKGFLVSSCRMFTTEDEGFIPIYKFLDLRHYYSISDIINFLKPLELDEDFANMIVLDAVILNPDRHLGNFGFIVDNNTFMIKRFAPVFDHNMALLARAMDKTIDDDLKDVRGGGHSIGADFVTAAKSLLTSRTRDILHSLLNFTLIPHKLYNLPEQRLAFLNKVIQQQVRLILE